MSEPNASPPIDEEEIFQAAVALPAAERAAYVLAACEGLPALRASVEQLLASHEDTGFMDGAAARTALPEPDAEPARAAPKGSGPSGKWEPPIPEELGELLPQYRIEGLLGRGGMGAVYKGIQPELERPVAIKILPTEVAADEEFVARFKREARTLAKLQHSRIITIHDYGETRKGHLYFVMEYIDGSNLREILRGPGLTEEQALLVVSQICDALYAAHKQGVVHRDIKPENVLITRDGYVKLADFGLARPPNEENEDLACASAVMGTPAYMAPEQYGGHADRRSDIYALGVMLYEMLTGRRPQGAFAPASVSAQTDGRLDQVVDKALQYEPERRYQEVSELKSDVDTIRATPTKKAGAPKPTPAGATRKQAGAITILALALLAAAVCLLWPKVPHYTSAQTRISEAPPAPAMPAVIPAPLATLATPPLTTQAATLPPVVQVLAEPSPPAPAPSAQITPTPAPVSIATPKPATEMEKWLAQFDGPQQETFQKQVLKPFEARVEGLQARYRAALDASIAKASATNQLAEALEWRTERQAFEKAKNVAADEVGTLAGVRDIRAAFRRELARLDEERTVQAKALFAKYDAVLAKNQTLLTLRQRLDDAVLLKAKREETAVAWLGSSSIITVEAAEQGSGQPTQTTPALLTPPASASLASATKSAPFVNSLGMKFMSVPITGGPTDGKRVLFSVWDTRVKDYEVFVRETKRESLKTVFSGPTHPVVNVTWEDATAFCAWLTERERNAGHLGVYRLPSDHEWSCAVEIGTREDVAKVPSEKSQKIDDAFPRGTQWPPTNHSGNYASEELLSVQAKGQFKFVQSVIRGYHDGYANTSPVGAYPANAFGLYDMGGNVFQWCEDWFDQKQKGRVMRGSSWICANRAALLSSARMSEPPATHGVATGFRCVLEPDAVKVVAVGGAASPTPPGVKPSLSRSGAGTKDAPFVNSLGMKFAPAPIIGGPTGGWRVLFSVWDTRVQDYEIFVKETAHTWLRPDFEQGPTHPVVLVDWEEARSFCAWLTEREHKAGELGANEKYRLPTDHEWSSAVGIGGREDAAKLPGEKSGKIDDAFPWGTQWPPPDNSGNYASEELLASQSAGKLINIKGAVNPGYHDGYASTSPVGSYAANRFGLFDMGGNVFQWCEDWSGNDQKKRVQRGSSWCASGRFALSLSCRLPLPPATRGVAMGFRCVLESAPLEAAVFGKAASPTPPGFPAATPSPATLATPAALKSETSVGLPIDIKFTAVDGRKVDVAQLRGKVVLIDYWATWCGPCMGEVPHVVEAYHRFHSKGFEIIGISFDQDKAALARFTTQKGMSWPQYFDGKMWQNEYGVKYGIHSIPTMWLIDKQGRIATTKGREDLAGQVEKLLAAPFDGFAKTPTPAP